MPLTGLISGRYGRKKTLIISAFGFAFSSLLCGFAQNLIQIIIFRGLQGVFGALLPPLAQSTIVSIFNGHERNKAMAFYGMGMMIGPIFGPVLGGYITDHMGWRWLFFINVPVCLLGAYFAVRYLVETPIVKNKIDWKGLFLLACGIGMLQFVLDKGNEVGWFSAHSIQLASFISLSALSIFIFRGINQQGGVINFKIFKDRYYRLSCFAMLLYCAVLLGTFSWLPLWLELFMNYSPTQAGLAIMPRGIACLLIMIITPKLLKTFDPRLLIAISCLGFAAGSIMIAHFNLLQGESAIVMPNILQGLATGFFFVPLSVMAYQTLPKHFMDEASGLFSFFRSLGSSIGVAIFSAIMSTESQASWNSLSGWITPYHQALYQWLNANNLQLSDPKAYAELGNLLQAQSNMIAFNDANYLFAGFCLLLMVIIWRLPRPRKHMPIDAVH
jgi:DHA2 family multidrug resistance protein